MFLKPEFMKHIMSDAKHSYLVLCFFYLDYYYRDLTTLNISIWISCAVSSKMEVPIEQCNANKKELESEIKQHLRRVANLKLLGNYYVRIPQEQQFKYRVGGSKLSNKTNRCIYTFNK